MKKLFIIVFALIVVYVVYQYAIEGTRFDNPKIFHVEDKNAVYKILADDKSGYYLLEGSNSTQGGKQFFIPIATMPANISDLVGKRVKIVGKTGWAQASKMPCQKGKENWCAPTNRETPMAVFIEKFEVVK